MLFFIFAVVLVGCGGGLTPQQQTEYDGLGEKQTALKSEQTKLQRTSKVSFKRLGTLEKRHRGIAKNVLSCGFDLKGQRLKFPFKHKPGYAAHFISGKSVKKPHTQCTTYRLKVRKK